MRALLEELRADPQAIEELRGILTADPPAPDLLTPAQVAAKLGVSARTVNRMAAEGRLPAVKVGRAWRFHADRLTPAPPSAGPAPTPRRLRTPARQLPDQACTVADAISGGVRTGRC